MCGSIRGPTVAMISTWPLCNRTPYHFMLSQHCIHLCDRTVYDGPSRRDNAAGGCSLLDLVSHHRLPCRAATVIIISRGLHWPCSKTSVRRNSYQTEIINRQSVLIPTVFTRSASINLFFLYQIDITIVWNNFLGASFSNNKKDA